MELSDKATAVVEVYSANLFEAQLVGFWLYQEVKFDFNDCLTGTFTLAAVRALSPTGIKLLPVPRL